ncbi:MAG TPA: hypothetical protein VE078_10020, partial [Thermoanaerobaculia bacterium]|nr:hypothetical protein [Thermoanaerobaculia bacterium]
IEILSRYSLVDYSLPITAFHRLLLDLGVTLSEMYFRLPSIYCGLFALVVLPRAFSGRLERFPVELFGWMVALSPAFILYSRIARSYMPMILFSFAAVMAFERWWGSGSRRPGILYVVFGALAIWIHLGAAPFVAAPFLFALGDLVRTRAWRRLRDLAVLGLGLALAMAAFLVPAAPSLLRLIGSKHKDVHIPLQTLGAVLRLEAGTRSWTLTIFFWLAALIGLVLLLRRHPRIGWFSVSVAGGHLAGILLLSPLGLNHPIVLNRYLLPVLPFILLWVAFALGSLRIPRSGLLGQGLQRSAARFFILFLFWTGPFLTSGYRESSFMHHNDFVGFFSPFSSIPGEAVPAIYRQLPEGPVVEYPWSTVWEQNRTFYIYQLLHKERVLVSAPFDIPREGIDLRNEIEPEPSALLASPARTVIVHLRLLAEEDRVVIPGRPFTKPMPTRLRRYYRRMGEKLAAQLQDEWGPADYSDRRVRAWDLERLRKKGKR